MAYRIINTKNFEIGYDEEENYGYFEHHKYGDECGGGLWFESGELTDFDGTFVLPKEVGKALIKEFELEIDLELYCS